MKKIVAAVCAILIGWCCTFDGIAEVIYAGENNYDFISKKPCPTYELDSLMSDDIQTKVSKALRSWFISEYAYLDDSV